MHMVSQIIKQNLSPEWDAMKVKMTDICNGSVDSEFLIECWDWDKATANDFIGCAKTTVRKLFEVMFRVCVCVSVCLCVCVSVCLCVCVCNDSIGCAKNTIKKLFEVMFRVCLCVCVCVDLHTYIHTYTKLSEVCVSCYIYIYIYM